ncbi:ABC transporter substrate-binding protein [Devosia sp.]|uniref:ABC transporter substrate-binding protein n=1 Tax=Devosia sp. TaxID=1871048 RepID=UPI003A912AD7
MIFRLVAAAMALMMTFPAEAQEFPVTIPHAFGETTIPAAPQRIVTWGWAAQDAVIALGEVPVGIPFFDYGGDEEGGLRWTRDAVADMGAAFPTILPMSNEPPVEAIAALKPDLILAVYSGLTAEQYGVLSQIAPVVAYPDAPWSTSWQQTIAITGAALGKPEAAAGLVGDLEQFITDETAKYPEVAGASFAGIAEYNGEVAVYAGLDSRMKFLEDAGLVLAPSVTELAQGENFYFSLSYELFDQLKSDLLISYFETPEADAAFFSNPVVAAQPQVAAGAVAHVVGAELINAISPPSALSLRWGYPKYIALIAEAARAAAAE